MHFRSLGAISLLLARAVAHPLNLRDESPSPSVVYVTQTQTVQTTQTVTDHTVQTDIVLETAYIINSMAPCLAVATDSPGTYALAPVATTTANSVASTASSTSPVVAATASPATITSTTTNSPSPTSASASGVTLYPSVPPSLNTSDPSNLAPSNGSTLWLTSNDTFAEVQANFTYPAVILPHSSYVSNISCILNGLEITFNDAPIFNYVESHWIAPFLLVTNTLGCSSKDDGQHTFWLVTALNYDNVTLTVQVTAVEVAVEDQLDHVTIFWGSAGGSAGSSGITLPGTIGAPANSTGAISNATTDPFATCSNPPDSYLGLATAPCGPDFDTTLDDFLGYFGFEDDLNDTELDEDLDEFIADVSDAGLKRHFTARGPGGGRKANTASAPKSSAKPKAAAPVQASNNKKVDTKVQKAAIQNAASAKAAAAQPAAASKLATTAAAAEKAVKAPADPDKAAKVLGSLVKTTATVGNAIKTALTPYDFSSPALPFDVAPAELKLYEKTGGQGTATVTCVNCAAKGNVQVQGAVAYTGLGFKTGQVSIAGDLSSVMNIVLHADGQFQTQQNKAILNYTVPGSEVKIGTYLTASVVISVGTVLDVNMTGAGDLFLSGSFAATGVNATLDIVNRGSSGVVGFNPTYTGSINGTAAGASIVGFSLPSEISVGLDVPGLFHQQVGLRTAPSVVATLTADVGVPAAPVTPASAAGRRDDTCSNGFSYAIDLHNKLDLDLLGNTTPLQSFDKLKVANGCLQKPAVKSSTKRHLSSRQDATTYNYLNTTDSSNGGISGDEQVLVNDTLAANQAYSANQTAEGITYATITDLTGTLALGSADNGNFALVDPSSGDATEFTFYDQVTDEDVFGNIFLYYADEMEALGVSRFRLRSEDVIPYTADIVTFTPIDSDDSSVTSGIFLPVDSSGNIYYTVVCNLDSLDSKIFLVTDYDGGIDTLMRTDLQSVITGGVVTGCTPITFQSGAFAGY